jgi:hypothetical protein
VPQNRNQVCQWQGVLKAVPRTFLEYRSNWATFPITFTYWLLWPSGWSLGASPGLPSPDNGLHLLQFCPSPAITWAIWRPYSTQRHWPLLPRTASCWGTLEEPGVPHCLGPLQAPWPSWGSKQRSSGSLTLPYQLILLLGSGATPVQQTPNLWRWDPGVSNFHTPRPPTHHHFHFPFMVNCHWLLQSLPPGSPPSCHSPNQDEWAASESPQLTAHLPSALMTLGRFHLH